MHREWDRSERSKFVITGEEAWFVTVCRGGDAPRLGEMLLVVTGVDLSDDAAVREVDEKLEDGEVLLGYVSGKVVEIHSSLAAPYPSVLARLKEVFGDVRVTSSGWTMDTGEDREDG